MSTKAISVDQYIENVAEDKKAAFIQLRKTILYNLPEGFEEVLSYGMPGYVVPHSVYPAGYHCNPELPLPFASIAAQKNFIAIYHMGLYGDPELMEWFKNQHALRAKKKLDMGKSCIRYKKSEDLPFDLIAELFTKITVRQYIDHTKKVLNL